MQRISNLVVPVLLCACARAQVGAPPPPPREPAVATELVYGVGDDARWEADGEALVRIDAASHKRARIVLPAGTMPVALAVGYGDVVFVADRDRRRLLRVIDGVASVFVEGERLGRPQSLLLSGGNLFVGTDDSLLSVGLADGAAKTVAPGIGSIVDVALDHVGYVVAAVEGRGLVRIAGDGEVVDIAPGPLGQVAFEPSSRRLHVVPSDGAEPVVLDYLRLVGEDPEAWAMRDARPMKPFTHRGIALAGAEYWPYRGDREPEYPAEVLWGFYPQQGVVFEGDRSPAAATPEAIACAEQSYRALHDWVESAPSAFWTAVERGASARFYLWINDYSEASASWPHEVRPNRFWYWERKPAVPGRVPGYWKWETTLTSDGQCLIPDAAQIEAYLGEKTAD